MQPSRQTSSHARSYRSAPPPISKTEGLPNRSVWLLGWRWTGSYLLISAARVISLKASRNWDRCRPTNRTAGIFSPYSAGQYALPSAGRSSWDARERGWRAADACRTKDSEYPCSVCWWRSHWVAWWIDSLSPPYPSGIRTLARSWWPWDDSRTASYRPRPAYSTAWWPMIWRLSSPRPGTSGGSHNRRC